MVGRPARHSEVRRVASEADSALREAADLRERLVVLEARYEALRTANLALWELLKSSSELTDENLLATLADIEGRFVRRDGKFVRQARQCPSCSRPMPARKNTCMYCGAEAARTDAFQDT